MGIYLNPGNDQFGEAISSKIYVDKTMLLNITNGVLNTMDKHICISRPRRFGKSMAANMLTAYYSRGCDSNELFSGFKIAESPDFEKHLNKYNVVHFDVKRFVQKAKNSDELVSCIEQSIKWELKEEYSDIQCPDFFSLNEFFELIFSKKHIPFVFIIDEWDCVFRSYKNDDNKAYLDFLCALLKGRPYVALNYATGILPVKKYGEHSALNMYQEYSMVNQAMFAEFTGFTSEDVADLCRQYAMPPEKMAEWYDGYTVNGYEIYNPQSVVRAITTGFFDNYWTKTESFEALKEYIYRDFNGLRQKIIQMISGEKIEIDTTTFENDMVTFNTVDDILTLLVHLGYLTYNFDTKEVWIPNKEVRAQFISTVNVLQWQEVTRSLKNSEKLMRATLEMDNERVAALIEEAHEANTSIFKYSDENSLACVISLAYYSARNDYIIHREFATGKGYADLVLIPRKHCVKPAMVIELKYNQSAETAIEQIKNKNYPRTVAEYSGEILLVGISYDDKKGHSCLIERLMK